MVCRLEIDGVLIACKHVSNIPRVLPFLSSICPYRYVQPLRLGRGDECLLEERERQRESTACSILAARVDVSSIREDRSIVFGLAHTLIFFSLHFKIQAPVQSVS